MNNAARKLSPAIFALALICFVLPFVSFSCQGQKIASLSGIQLVTGSSVQQPQMFGPPKSETIDAEPLAVMVFFCGILGLVLSFVRGRSGLIAPAASAGLATILLLALRSKIEGGAAGKGGGILQVNFEIGYYALVILLLAAIVLNIFVLIQGKSVPLPAGKDPGSKFCTQCGSSSLSTDAFCKDCGAKFAP